MSLAGRGTERGYKRTVSLTRDDFESEPEWALAVLSDVLGDLQEGLEAGDVAGRAYFSRTAGRPFEITVYNTLLRYHARLVLRSRARRVEDDPEYDVTDVANLGLHLRHGRFQVRARKSPDLTPPVPGASASLQAYYRQETLVPDDRLSINLLALWRPSPAGIEMRLTKPVAGDMTRDSVAVEWNVPVPAIAHERAAESSAPPETATVEDLPFRAAAKEAEERREGEEDR